MRPIRSEPQQTNLQQPHRVKQLTVRNAQSAVMRRINVAALKRGVLKETILLPSTSLPIRTCPHVPPRLVKRSTEKLYQWQV